MRRTSVTAAVERRVVGLTDPELFSFPFLYMAGKYDFQPFSDEEIRNLRRFLSFGGFLLADNTLGNWDTASTGVSARRCSGSSRDGRCARSP